MDYEEISINIIAVLYISVLYYKFVALFAVFSIYPYCYYYYCFNNVLAIYFSDHQITFRLLLLLLLISQAPTSLKASLEQVNELIF